MTQFSQIRGTSTMLMGAVGTGKTSALKSWLALGHEVLCIFTEPSFEVILEIPCASNLHYTYIPPTSASFADMIASAELINTLTFKQLSNLDDISKGKYKEFIRVLTTLSNFKCDRCARAFGPVDGWDNNRVLWFDSLSGLNVQAMNLVVGSKPMKALPDWGMAMDNEERLIQKLAASLTCHFVLTAHVEPEKDEQTGFTSQFAATLGRKLAPRLPRFFSDVVLAKRTNATFEWSTTALGVDLKARNLPFSDHLEASFKPLYETWKARILKGEADAKTQPQAQATPQAATA